MRDLWTLEAQYRRWLRVELVALEALEELGVVPEGTSREVRAKARIDIERILGIEREIGHDLMAFLKAVEESVGPAGRWLHFGLTSSDVKDTALSLAMSEALEIVLDKARPLLETLLSFAREHKGTLILGRTHGRYAEPTTLGLKVLVWAAELSRGIRRLERAREAISVGKLSGAVGTYAHFPREAERIALEKLGLRPAAPTTQIIPRDRHAEVLWALAQAASLVEKIALEVRHLSRSEVAEVEEGRPEGSSAMPHKRNPILSERLCGLARILRSTATPALENNALWHERDMSHSSVERIVIPEAFILVDYMLERCQGLVEGLKVYPGRMLARLEGALGLPFSGGIMLALVRKGFSRAAAHAHVARLSAEAEERGKHLRDLALKDELIREHLSEDEIREVFDLEALSRRLEELFEKLYGEITG